MTVVTEQFKNGLNQPVSGAVTFTPCSLEVSGDVLLANCPLTFQFDETGEFVSPPLLPGCYVVKVVLDCRNCAPTTHAVTVPETGEWELAELIVFSGPTPANPYVISVGGLSGVVTAEQIAAMVAANSTAGAITATGIAGETLGGHRVVYRAASGEWFYASNTNPAIVGAQLGVTTSSAVLGGSVTVVMEGEILEPSWSFTVGEIWLGTNGLLTQVPPVGPAAWFRCVMGYASTSTRMYVDRDESVILAA